MAPRKANPKKTVPKREPSPIDISSDEKVLVPETPKKRVKTLSKKAAESLSGKSPAKRMRKPVSSEDEEAPKPARPTPKRMKNAAPSDEDVFRADEDPIGSDTSAAIAAFDPAEYLTSDNRSRVVRAVRKGTVENITSDEDEDVFSRGPAGSPTSIIDKANKKSGSSLKSAFVARVSSTPPRGSADEAGSLKEFIVPDGVENIEWDTTDDDINGGVSSEDDIARAGPNTSDGHAVEDPNDPTPHSVPAPKMCEVTPKDKSDLDKYLRKTYENLPPLRAAVMTYNWLSSRDKAGFGHYQEFAHWVVDRKELCKGFNPNWGRKFVVFSGSGGYINASTADPRYAYSMESGGIANTTYLTDNIGSPLMVITSGFCTGSNLVNPINGPTAKGQPQKYVKCIDVRLHDHEASRFAGFMGMVMHQTEFQTDFGADTGMRFSTRSVEPPGLASSSVQSKGISPKKNKSAESRVADHGPRKGINYSISAFDTVPVYDAIHSEFDLTKHVLHDLDSHNVSRWTRDIPVGSFVAVAHTCSFWRPKGANLQPLRLSNNLNWVVVLGTPRRF